MTSHIKKAANCPHLHLHSGRYFVCCLCDFMQQLLFFASSSIKPSWSGFFLWSVVWRTIKFQLQIWFIMQVFKIRSLPTTVHFIKVCQRLFGDNFFYSYFELKISWCLSTFFYITRNEISASSAKRHYDATDGMHPTFRGKVSAAFYHFRSLPIFTDVSRRLPRSMLPLLR